MANLCVAACHSVNRVSASTRRSSAGICSGILPAIQPENSATSPTALPPAGGWARPIPSLTDLITDCIGGGFLKDFSRLAEFGRFRDDAQVLERLAEIKRQEQAASGRILRSENRGGTEPRLHLRRAGQAPARIQHQQMNALEILAQYQSLKDGQTRTSPPHLPLRGESRARVLPGQTDHQAVCAPSPGHRFRPPGAGQNAGLLSRRTTMSPCQKF